MKKIFLIIVVITVSVVTTRALGGSKETRGVIKNSSGKGVVVKDLHKDHDIKLPVGESAAISAELGVDIFVSVFCLNGNKVDTVIVKMKFPKDGDVFELKNSDLSGPQGNSNRSQNQTVEPTSKSDDKKTGKNVGKKVTNELDGILFFQDKGLCLAPGETSKEPVELSRNEKIVIEKNYRLWFLEINDFFARNDKVYVVDENTLAKGKSQDSVKVYLTTLATDYVFIDDQTKEVRGIKPVKGRKEFFKNFPEGPNTIMIQILGKDGTVQIRYFPLMASENNNREFPTQDILDNPPLFFGEKKSLPIGGFDRNCSFELLDNKGKSCFGTIDVDEGDTTEEKPFFIGMNKVKVTYYEETPQGRVTYAFEYFKLVSESDSIFTIDKNYFWSLVGKPVLIIPTNITKSTLFTEFTVWVLNKKLNPRQLVIKRDYPSKKVYAREGIARLPGVYLDGMNWCNLTTTFIVSGMDKNRKVKIKDENINRTPKK